MILIRHLFERGFRHIGMEMGLADGKGVDRYLETGDEKHLERLTVLGYKGFQRPDRDYEVAGFVAMKNPEFRTRFQNAETWFFRQVRSLNASLDDGQPRLRWFGYDVDVFPGKGYEDARQLLEPHASEPKVKRILDRLAWVENETIDEEVARLQEVLEMIDGEEVALLGKHGVWDLRRTIRGLRDSLPFFEVARKGPLSGGWLPALVKREKVMHRQMDELLAVLPEGEKIILMGHNLHLCKHSETAYFGAREGDRMKLWRTIGTHVAERLPGEVYAIWLLYDHGRHGNILLEAGFEEVESDPGRIEHLLARAGPLYFLPFHSNDPREAFLDEDLNFVQNGSLASGRLLQQADAVFFTAEVKAPALK
jgi:hypothetical protein